jgi:maltodextrin utilization protein YvdJ
MQSTGYYPASTSQQQQQQQQQQYMVQQTSPLPTRPNNMHQPINQVIMDNGQQQQQQQDLDDDELEEDEKKPMRRSGRRKIKIEYIEDKTRRHITFSKRKAGIMKKVTILYTTLDTFNLYVSRRPMSYLL